MASLLSVADALERVLGNAAPLPAAEVPLAEAAGLVLASPVKARRTQPPADVSAMDGYAVRSNDVAKTPVRLKIVGEVAAGRPFAHPVGACEAARIFTGGVMPDGAELGGDPGTHQARRQPCERGKTVVARPPRPRARTGFRAR